MEDINEMLAEQQRELERIRSKRNKSFDTEKLRRLLNVLFLLLAFVGVILYFAMPDSRVTALVVIGAGMILKVAEFFIRFMF